MPKGLERRPRKRSLDNVLCEAPADDAGIPIDFQNERAGSTHPNGADAGAGEIGARTQSQRSVSHEGRDLALEEHAQPAAIRAHRGNEQAFVVRQAADFCAPEHDVRPDGSKKDDLGAGEPRGVVTARVEHGQN